jgi:hypothetical protein
MAGEGAAYAAASRGGKPVYVQIPVALGAILLLLAGYLLLLHALLPYMRLDQGTSASDRDNLLLAVHGAGLLLSAVVGFVLGRWLNGTGLPFAALFLVVIAFLMVGAQAAAFELACRGHNDLIRHWTCDE